MKDEYDFSKAERGKFFRRDVQLIPPVHLDPEVLRYLAERAEARGTSLNELVNELFEEGHRAHRSGEIGSRAGASEKCRLEMILKSDTYGVEPKAPCRP
jgi:hypothetical protein